MINSSTNSSDPRVEILIRGTVQGVGFRPFVYNLASRLDISGTVSNTSEGVVIQAVSGTDEGLNLFIEALQKEAPPLSQILSFETKPLKQDVKLEKGFNILFSEKSSGSSATIPPDISICLDCYKDISSSSNRRFNYPFTNCTNCGPRFTIVENIPYDRPKTSMKVFPMCEKCQAEYQDPTNRRFHAQPNACPTCGPHLSLHDKKGNLIECASPLAETIASFNENKVVAIRGLGGFHLAVNGLSQDSIQTLRNRKGRPAKPLAIMAPNIATAKKYAIITEQEEELLNSPEHPIVLLKKRGENLPSNLAPSVTDIGIMLPYTPLHHVLFLQKNCPEVLVMTSGNVSGVPICTANDDALDRLSHIVDNYLLHNREIVTRVDDSVTKIVTGNTRVFRRARGYVPSPIVVPWVLPEIIACGGGLKSTFCLGRDKTAFISQHIGDLANLESYDFFMESINHLKQVFDISPVVAACDLHPDYMSSRYAAELGLPLIKVQHHHAHAVSVMAEHGIDEPCLAIILDGTGYGTDRSIWGGEILQTSLTEFTRLGHLSQLPLPGGDKAAAEPWRVAISALLTTFGEDDFSSYLPETLTLIEKSKRDTILSMVSADFNCPKTSSCGRLFDAISSLLGIQHFATYEGQAAIELEAVARKATTNSWKNDLIHYMDNKSSNSYQNAHENWEISSTEFVKVALDLLKKGTTVSAVALEFHFNLIAQFVNVVSHLSEQNKINKVLLSGGCLQNSLLLEGFIYALTQKGLQPITGGKVPLNDGGISLGQTIIGGLSHVYSTTNEGH